jgi:hypothetical protein
MQVWFADDSIPRIVDFKLNHPEYLLVSGNIVTSPLMGWVHYHLGAHTPTSPKSSTSQTTRRSHNLKRSRCPGEHPTTRTGKAQMTLNGPLTETRPTKNTDGYVYRKTRQSKRPLRQRSSIRPVELLYEAGPLPRKSTTRSLRIWRRTSSICTR